MAGTTKSDEIFFDIRLPKGRAAAYDESEAPWNFHIVGIASHRGGVLAGKERDRKPGPSAVEVVLE